MTGCAAQISPDDYKTMPEVDYVIDNINKLKQKTWDEILEDHQTTLFGRYIYKSFRCGSLLQNESFGVRESLVFNKDVTIVVPFVLYLLEEEIIVVLTLLFN